MARKIYFPQQHNDLYINKVVCYQKVEETIAKLINNKYSYLKIWLSSFLLPSEKILDSNHNRLLRMNL